MKDWVQTLKSTQSFATAWQTRWEEPATSASYQDAPPALLKTKLFQDLRTLSQQYSGAKVLFNVQMAAIHLFFLLQGYQGDKSLVSSKNFALVLLTESNHRW